MKLIIRILNFVIMAICAAATVFLFTPPAFSFNSNIAIDVAAFSKFVPETDFTRDLNIVDLVGAESIHVGIKFDLAATELYQVMGNDKEKINDKIISKNVDDIVKEMHEPVDLITDFPIRYVIKSIIEQQITQQVNAAVESYKEKYPEETSEKGLEEILDDAGINDRYFTDFSNALYNEANREGATVESTDQILVDQVNDALYKASETGLVDTSSFNDEAIQSILDTLNKSLNDLHLVNADGTLKPIGKIAYIYLADYLNKQLTGKVDAETEAELPQKTGEKDEDYADRLLGIFVLTQMPSLFYQIVAYISLGLFIGLFVFAGIWALLLLITLLKTFTKKPWTIFGFWFWLVGFIEVIMGIGITIFGKFILPTINISSLGLPLASVILVPRTYAIIPSLLFLVMIAFAVVYGIFKEAAKNKEDIKREKK